MSLFGRTIVEFPLGGISDHSSALISVGIMQSFGPKPFKFFNYWLNHEGFLNWVDNGWFIQVEGYPMYRLYVKLKAVKVVLKEQIWLVLVI